MNCPICDRGTLAVTHTYKTPGGMAQRRECLASGCGTVVTTQVAIVAINPKRGRGAAALARRMIRAHEKVSQSPESSASTTSGSEAI